MAEREEVLVSRGRAVLAAAERDASGDAAAAVATIDSLVTEIGEARSPLLRGLVAELLETKLTLLGRLGSRSGQQLVADELITRFGADTDKAAISAAWATMIEIWWHLADGRFDRATECAGQLTAMFVRQPDTQDLTRFGSLLLQAADWLMDARIDEPALRICVTVFDRLRTASDRRRRVVAAGAQLSRQRALVHLGRMDEGLRDLRAFVCAGELALDAIEQAEARREPDDPKQPLFMLGLARIAVLLDADREEEARAERERLAAEFDRDPSPDVDRLLAGLAQILEE